MSDSTIRDFEKGAQLVRPYLHLEGVNAREPNDELEQGIRILERCSRDRLWEVNWLLGKAYEAKRDYFNSAKHFEIAIELEPNRKEVIHELIIALLRIKEFAKSHNLASQHENKLDPLLTFDLALVKSAIVERREEAMAILKSFQWPSPFKMRVLELIGQINSAKR